MTVLIIGQHFTSRTVLLFLNLKKTATCFLFVSTVMAQNGRLQWLQYCVTLKHILHKHLEQLLCVFFFSFKKTANVPYFGQNINGTMIRSVLCGHTVESLY